MKSKLFHSRFVAALVVSIIGTVWLSACNPSESDGGRVWEPSDRDKPERDEANVARGEKRIPVLNPKPMPSTAKPPAMMQKPPVSPTAAAESYDYYDYEDKPAGWAPKPVRKLFSGNVALMMEETANAPALAAPAPAKPVETKKSKAKVKAKTKSKSYTAVKATAKKEEPAPAEKTPAAEPVESKNTAPEQSKPLLAKPEPVAQKPPAPEPKPVEKPSAETPSESSWLSNTAGFLLDTSSPEESYIKKQSYPALSSVPEIPQELKDAKATQQQHMEELLQERMDAEHQKQELEEEPTQTPAAKKPEPAAAVNKDAPVVLGHISKEKTKETPADKAAKENTKTDDETPAPSNLPPVSSLEGKQPFSASDIIGKYEADKPAANQ